MKRIITFLLIVIACITASAERITEQQALQKAQEFMKGKKFLTSAANARGKDSQTLPIRERGYYVFNVADSAGFVIVAGDDRMPEILGYSDHGKLDEETAPCGLKWLLGCYERMARDVSVSNIKTRSITRAAKASVAPFITTTWGQNSPYNATCPKFKGARCLTGCVATAMAQIMNYYCWPNETTTPIPAYTSFTNKISMPQLETTTFTWGFLNKRNLSKLMLYCGQAVQMDYGPDESGAGSIGDAMKHYFGYDENLKEVQRDDYSDEQWNDLLYEEIAQSRPVYYYGSDGQEGHAFILCGYADEHFYINWGWDGGADGYFILDGISPSVGAYNLGQGGVIGIKPNGTPTPITFYPRKIVMENKAWTGEGANEGRYVLGIETIKRLTAEYPDDFIAIETHVSDEMDEAENYTYMTSKYGGSPCCYINRNAYLGSYYSDIKPIVELLRNKAVAVVEASAVYAKPDKSAITVKTESTFGFNSTEEDLRLAFVLLEDHVGPYSQNNSSYSNPSAPDNPNDWLNYWVHQGPHVEMLFDNVARGIYGDAQGIKGSLPSAIEKGKTYDYEYTFNIPSPKWDYLKPYNSDNFRVVALLIDKSTGEILNAYQTNIKYDDSVNNLTFEYRNEGKRLSSGEVLRWKSKGKAEKHLCLGTNRGSNGLKLCTFNGKQASGTATLEILSNTLNPSSLTWGMGANSIVLSGNSHNISFTTDSRGVLDVDFTANDIQQFGELEAILTASINGVSQSVVIKFVHQQSNAWYGSGTELFEGQSWWNNDTGSGYMQGTGREERYSAATYIPAHLFGDKIPTIGGIAFWGATSSMENIEVWISTHLPANGENPDIATYKFPDEELILEENNYIVFNQEYQIPEGGVYVGYSFDIVSMNTFRSATPIVFSNKTREGALWFKTESKPEWIDRFDDLQGNLKLCILFGGDVIKKNAVSITNIEPVFALTNTTKRIRFDLTNESTKSVDNLDVEIEGGVGWMGLSGMVQGVPVTCEMDVNVGSVAEYRPRQITVTKVNGVPNESDHKSAMIPFYVSGKEVPSKVVLEEFTGTWCGFSTAANLALEAYKKEFGDKLIIINAHHGRTNEKDPSQNAIDPMEIAEYEEISGLSGGRYPSCVLNRNLRDNLGEYSYYPLYEGYGEGTFNLNANIADILAKPMPGVIEAGAEWIDESKNSIKISTRTTFELNSSELPLQIGYVLLEDGMSGEGQDWAQRNSYAGIEEIEDRVLEELTKLPASIINQKYNNVAVAAWSPYKGVEGSLVGPFTAGKPIDHSFVADIGSNKIIQNKDNLSVVTLLLDKNRGTILNAAKCKIEAYGTGIVNLKADSENGDVFDLSGRKVKDNGDSKKDLPKGIYIIKGKKVVIK